MASLIAPLALYFVHGWGYDRTFWDKLHEDLADLTCSFYEAGYFGAPPLTAPPSRPYLAIGHSAGVMTILSQKDHLCRGLISFNGFCRFTRTSSFPLGMPERILQRMILRQEQTPQATLTQFRTLCGESNPELPPVFEKNRLLAGLEFLRDEDASPALTQWETPLVTITGSHDPLSPAQAGLPCPAAPGLWKSECWKGGHLLPKTHRTAALTLIRETLSHIGPPPS